jgi:ACT domain-containing protein
MDGNAAAPKVRTEVKDRVGIIARVAATLAENGVNILDISQTILQGFFTMIMLVDLGESGGNLDKVRADLDQAASDLGMQVTIQHEDVFNFMHRI